MNDFAGTLARYRARPPEPLRQVLAQVGAELESPANIQLWQQGIERPDPTNGREAFSNFAGFARRMVSAAATAVSECDGEARFAANDLEQALEPARVAAWLATISATDGATERHFSAAEFLEKGMSQAAAERSARFRPAAP